MYTSKNIIFISHYCIWHFVVAVVIWCAALGNTDFWRLSIQGNIWPGIVEPPKSRKSPVEAIQTGTRSTVSCDPLCSLMNVVINVFFGEKVMFSLLWILRYSLMLACWELDPAARPTFTEIRIKLDEIFGEIANQILFLHKSVCCHFLNLNISNCRTKGQLFDNGQLQQTGSGSWCRISMAGNCSWERGSLLKHYRRL